MGTNIPSRRLERWWVTWFACRQIKLKDESLFTILDNTPILRILMVVRMGAIKQLLTIQFKNNMHETHLWNPNNSCKKAWSFCFSWWDDTIALRSSSNNEFSAGVTDTSTQTKLSSLRRNGRIYVYRISIIPTSVPNQLVFTRGKMDRHSTNNLIASIIKNVLYNALLPLTGRGIYEFTGPQIFQAFNGFPLYVKVIIRTQPEIIPNVDLLTSPIRHPRPCLTTTHEE